jgi:hypothetical protein
MLRALGRPFVKAAKVCTIRTGMMRFPLDQHVAAADASGEDLTVTVRQEFLATQRDLLNYRIEKFWEEIADLRNGAGVSLASVGVSDLVLFVRFVTALVFAYMMGVVIGRRSVFPALRPDSPFVVQARMQNPNYADIPQRY